MCLLNRWKSMAHSARHSTARWLGLEALEDRWVPTANSFGTPLCPDSGDNCSHAVGLSVETPAHALYAPGTVDSEADEFTTVSKWPQPGGLGSQVTITYSYSNLLDGSMDLTSSQLRAAVQEALGRWAAVAPLRFVELVDSGPSPSESNYDGTNRPMVRFGHHSFDGPWGVLAHAYFPSSTGLGGDIHFDVAERWTLQGASYFDFLEVATHEIGHALGLHHEPMPSSGGNTAIMNPYYRGWYSGLGTSFLFQDDVNGIRHLYGTGTGSVSPRPTIVTVVSAGGVQYGLGDDRAVYRWDGSVWGRISGYNVDSLVSAGGQLYILAERGVYRWTGSVWGQISGNNLDALVSAGGSLHAYSASERAVFRWTGSVWERFSGYNVKTLVEAGGQLYILAEGDPGEHAVYRWTGSVWTQFSGDNVKTLVEAGGQLYILAEDYHQGAFRKAVYRWDGSVWGRISEYNRRNLSVINDTLYSLADDGYMYKYVNGVWIRA